MENCDEGDKYSFTRYGVKCDSCNATHKGGDTCGKSRSGRCNRCGKDVHYVAQTEERKAHWRHNSSKENTGTDERYSEEHTRAIDKLLELTSKGTLIRIDYSKCTGMEGITYNPNCEGWKEPFTIHPYEYKFSKEVALVCKDSYGEEKQSVVDIFGRKEGENLTKSNSLIIEVYHTHHQRRNAIGIPWHEVSATEVNRAKEEGVLTLKAVNVCSSCSREGSVVMEERIDKVLKLMRG
jgi:hypothetical protein